MIYYRSHPNKFKNITLNFIRNLSEKFNVYIVGDYFKNKNVKNLGLISKNKIYRYLAMSKMTVSSDENLFSNFNLDCIESNIKILIGSQYLVSKTVPKKYFFKITKKEMNYKNNNLKKLIKKIENKKFKIKNKENFQPNLLKNQIDNYFSCFL